MLLAALLLLVVRCPRGYGEPSLAPPGSVQFVAQTFHHVLRWAPATNHTPGSTLYEVQYRRYGKDTWRPVPSCFRTVSLSCDLTHKTRAPAHQYLARVRAVARNSTSSWARTVRFSPKEATLWLSNMSLSVAGNTVHMTLQPPISSWNNSSLTYQDIHPRGWEYVVHIRKVSDGSQHMYFETRLEFDIPLVWGEQYCISVEPRITSLPNHAKGTEEQCISIPHRQESTRLASALGSVFISLAATGTLAAVVVYAYIRKPTKTPSVLKSLATCNSPGMPDKVRSLGTEDLVLCVEADSIQQLSLALKDRVTPDGVSWDAGVRPPPPRTSCWSPTLCLMDSSACSTDSGICLQDTAGSLSHFSAPGPPSCGSLSLSSREEDRSLDVQERLPSSSRTKQGALNLEHVDVTVVRSSGYQKQSGAPLEVVLCPRSPTSGDGVAHSEPSSAPGYLKQTSFIAPSGLRHVPFAQELGQGDILDRLDLGKLHLSAGLPLDVSGPLGLLSETLLTLAFLDQDSMSFSPHLAALHSSSA